MPAAVGHGHADEVVVVAAVVAVEHARRLGVDGVEGRRAVPALGGGGNAAGR